MSDQSERPVGDQRQSQYTEEFRVSGERVLSKVKELVHEGNVRRITIKNDEGKTLIEIPLTLGVIGTVLLPVWAAIGAIAALAANLTIAVDRVDTAGQGPADGGAGWNAQGRSSGQVGEEGWSRSTERMGAPSVDQATGPGSMQSDRYGGQPGNGGHQAHGGNQAQGTDRAGDQRTDVGQSGGWSYPPADRKPGEES